MVGFLRREKRSNEAAIKYLLLGAFSSGFLAYGFSVLYGLAGSTRLTDIAAAVAARPAWDPVVFLAMATTAVGLLFKIAAAPFHMWRRMRTKVPQQRSRLTFPWRRRRHHSRFC